MLESTINAEFSDDWPATCADRNTCAWIAVKNLNRGAIQAALVWAKLAAEAEAAGERVLARRAAGKVEGFAEQPVAELVDLILGVPQRFVSGDDLARLQDWGGVVEDTISSDGSDA